MDDAISAQQRALRTREIGQHGLFGAAAAPAPEPFLLRDAPQWSEEERLASEYAVLGFYVSGHPLEKFASRLAEMGAVSLAEVEGQRNGKELTIAALIVGTRPMRSKKGARWAIFTIQDMTGVQELLAFPESFQRFEQVLKTGTPLLMKVRVQVEEAGTRLSLQEVRRLETIAERANAPEFRVRLAMGDLSEERMHRLELALAEFPGPSPVVFEVLAEDGVALIVQCQQRVRVCAELAAAVRQICGEDAISAEAA